MYYLSASKQSAALLSCTEAFVHHLSVQVVLGALNYFDFGTKWPSTLIEKTILINQE